MKPSFTVSMKLNGFTRKISEEFALAMRFSHQDEGQATERTLVQALSKLADDGQSIELRSGIVGDYGRARLMMARVERNPLPEQAPKDWQLEMNMGILRKFVQVS